MTDDRLSVSLLPCLETGRGTSHLRISLSEQGASTLEKTTTPFLVIDDSDPLAQLIEARFLTDAGDVLQRVFLLVQKDQYHLDGDELSPIGNREVDSAWQRAFSCLNEERSHRQITALPIQVAQSGRLLPLTSLFFCRTRQLFFCPPCPRCGEALQQCVDDGLLSAAGLQPYSRSLKRYLYCPMCDSQRPSDFYVYELDNHDPQGLKDRWTLIKDLRHLFDRRAASEFPCRACSGHEECFASDFAASSRIVPFSFYPFYMLILEAMSLPAADFQPFLGGATYEEVKTGLNARGEFGRLHCLRSLRDAGSLETLFLYDRQKKFFLETLYLKLSFLGDIHKVLYTKRAVDHPYLRPSINGIWVKLAEQSALLPTFWNFKVAPVSISKIITDGTAVPGSYPISPLRYFGVLWFYTLLANKHQGTTDILSVLQELLSQGASVDECSPGNLFGNPINQAFSHSNIFWDAHHEEIPGEWHDLWKRSLELAWSLWAAGIRGDDSWSHETFLLQCEELRGEAKNALFEQPSDLQQEPARPVYADYSRSADTEIHDVLVKLIAKWQPVPEPATGTAPPSPKAEKEVPEETVIASRGNEEPLAETVIIASPEIGKQSQLRIEPQTQAMQDAAKKKVEERPEQQFIAETVILSIEKKER